MKSSSSIWTPTHFIPSPNYTQRKAATPSQWQQVLSRFLQFLSPKNEPTVSQIWRDGQQVWRVYDPQTQEKMTFATETEVRSWLESRYYTN